MKTRVNPFATMVFLSAAAAGLGQPAITEEPQSGTNLTSTTATFQVAAYGTQPLSYQWQKLGSDWADLVGRTNASLVLTNVQTADAGDYRVVITNVEGAITSKVAHLTVVAPPTAFIKSLAVYQAMAAYRGSNTALTINASGTAPFSFQWRLEGRDLSDKTNQTITIAAAGPAEEGNYSAVVANSWGAITSAPVRLYVTPPADSMLRRDFTNAARQRLPYWYRLPDAYDANSKYPLVCILHGSPGSEDYFQTYADIGPQALGLVFTSYRQQLTNPAIVVWPARRSGEGGWTAQHVQQILELLDRLSVEFSVDTNRLYIGGMSEGVHAVWDCLGSRPGFFAGAIVLAGQAGSASASSVAGVPLWTFCAFDDTAVGGNRALVRFLLQAGGSPIYTEYLTGGHMDGIARGLCTPQAIDWLLAQHRGQPSTNEPLLTIAQPTPGRVYATGAAAMDLAGQATALGEAITNVFWTNCVASLLGGLATGTTAWTAIGVPLQQAKTNLVTVVAATTSWAPGFGGRTTFSDSLSVSAYPLRATLIAQGTGGLLNWTGGGPPYSVQRATSLSAGEWMEFLTDATPPIPLSPPLAGEAAFYRVVGH